MKRKFVFIFLFIAITISETFSTGYFQKQKWYEGGTLHQSKIKDWKKATAENKLATCADFIASAKKASNMNDLLAKSVEVRACINEATKDLVSTDNEKVADIAALCIIALKY
jgi:hypothetical protein